MPRNLNQDERKKSCAWSPAMSVGLPAPPVPIPMDVECDNSIVAQLPNVDEQSIDDAPMLQKKDVYKTMTTGM